LPVIESTAELEGSQQASIVLNEADADADGFFPEIYWH
jgi:hypothetical protein